MARRVILMTHAQLERPEKSMTEIHMGVAHSDEGKDMVKRMAHGILNLRIKKDRSQPWVGVIVKGIGRKYYQVAKTFKGFLEGKNLSPKYSLTRGILGLPVSIFTKFDTVLDENAEDFCPIDCYEGVAKYISIDDGWDFVKEMDGYKGENGYKILCGGRQFMKILGIDEDFDIASAYLLDWKKRESYRLVHKGGIS